MNHNFPYLTKIFNKKTNEEIICLILSISKNYFSYYNVLELKKEDREEFFSKVNSWFKREPILPVSIYYQDSFDKFDYCKHYLGNNDYNFIEGFEGIKLKNLSERRIKRKIIHLEERK